MAFDIVVKKEATVDDTLQLIINAINICSRSPFVREVVREISKLHDPQTDPRGFIKALFDWCCRNGKYQLDIPGIEEVWTPELTTRMHKFDCKKITVKICSVLKAAGIEPIAKHVYYRGPDGSLENFTHIYTIVPASSLGGSGIEPYITVDPTNDCKYNAEVRHSKATLYHLNGQKMELHMMGRAAVIPQQELIPAQQPIPRPSTSSFNSALNSSACQVQDSMRAICNMPPSSLCGPADYTVVGLKAKSGNKVLFEYTTAELVKHTAAVPAMFAMRAAFLGLLYLGKFLAKTPLKFNLTIRLAKAWQKNPAAVRKFWWLRGGEKTAKALQTAIMKGSGISISGPYGYGYDYPGLFRPGMNGTTIGEPVTLATAAAALGISAPMIAAAKSLLKQLGIFKEGDTDPEPPTGENPPEPPPAPGPKPDAGSFATHSIDNIFDLLNFIKGSAILSLGAAMNPHLILPTQIVVAAAFIYAIRNKILK